MTASVYYAVNIALMGLAGFMIGTNWHPVLIPATFVLAFYARRSYKENKAFVEEQRRSAQEWHETHGR